MPFELGLAISWAKWTENFGSGLPQHEWFVSDGLKNRAQKSISDLNGVDIYIHQQSPQTLLACLCNAFTKAPNPGVPSMMQTYDNLVALIPKLIKNAGASDLFEPRMFNDLILATSALIEERTRTTPV